MPTILFDERHLRIDGVPALIQAGTLHYFRLPHPDLWRPVLERMRMAGLNAAMVPFPWAYHNPDAGLYDFTGLRDLERLLDEVERVGLWLIAYAGPWVRADLDAGGVPSWFLQMPDAIPKCGSDVPAGPSFTFLRCVWEWWERLFPFFRARDNLLLLALDPGPCADGPGLPRYLPPLTEMAKKLEVQVPLVSVKFTPEGTEAVEADARRFVPVGGPQDAGLAEVRIGSALTWGGESREHVLRLLGPEHPRGAMSGPLGRGATGYALTPVHVGVTWGYWGTADACTAHGVGALVDEGAALSEGYYRARRMAFTLETLGEALVAARPAETLYVSEAQYLEAARTAETATVAFLSAVGMEDGAPRLSMALGDQMLVTEPIPLPADAVRVLPLNWRCAGGKVWTTTLEPILHTVVAGRRLLALANETGGDVLLSDDFRLRHARGPVRTQRSDAGLAVRFEPSRLTSLLLDGPDGPLQLLALAPHFAARVWPLDDSWRVTPAYPAAWNPAPEDPARGLVIGPDWVAPRPDGGYDYLVGEKGFGYRWGPWRGSDPHTWLAPLTWRAPDPVALPPLTWDLRHSGAPEVLPDYDDRAWRPATLGASVAVTSRGIDPGFVWYRGRFSGPARAIVLRTPEVCDVFLNGELIAALHPAADAGLKTLPAPERLLREDNVLAVLVRRQNRGTTWDAAGLPHGLLACAPDGGAPVSWRVRGGLTGERFLQGFPGFADWAMVPETGASSITWHRATFDLTLRDDVESPLFLFIDGAPTWASLYLNGQLIGHYGEPRGPQHRFWLPEGLLRRQGNNEVLIAQWTRGAEPALGTVRLEAGAALRWVRQPGKIQ